MFDIGNVLVTRRAWECCYAAAGIACERPREEISRAFARLRGGTLTPSAYFALIGRLCGCDPRVVRSAHAEIAGSEIPGVRSLVAALCRSGVPLGLLSNIDAFHWWRLFSAPDLRATYRGCRLMARRFARNFLAAHQVGLLKPDPRLFRRYEQVSGASGASIMYFDDDPANVEAAAEAGWSAHRVVTTTPVCEQIRAQLIKAGAFRSARARLTPRAAISQVQ